MERAPYIVIERRADSIDIWNYLTRECENGYILHSISSPYRNPRGMLGGDILAVLITLEYNPVAAAAKLPDHPEIQERLLTQG